MPRTYLSPGQLPLARAGPWDRSDQEDYYSDKVVTSKPLVEAMGSAHAFTCYSAGSDVPKKGTQEGGGGSDL